MSRRKSDEVRVTEYFENADQAKIEVVFEIVKGIMKRRGEIASRLNELQGVTKPKLRRKRRTKVEMAATKVNSTFNDALLKAPIQGKAVSFKPEELG